MTTLYGGVVALSKLAGLAGMVLLLSSPTSADAGATRPQASSRALVGFANPSRRVAYAPTPRGRIQSIQVEEGGAVRNGEPLLTLDDEAQRRRTEIARADAESRLEIDLAKLRLETALAEKARVEDLAQDQRASTKELTDAQALAAAAAIELKKAEFDQQQQERDYELQQKILADHALIAPFDGYTVQVLKQVGDVVGELEPVIVLAQLDPLEVIFECPVDAAGAFRAGQTVSVAPPGDAWPLREGRVASVNAVANAASQTMRLRVLVPNADLAWPAGLKVTLNAAAPPGAAASAAQAANGGAMTSASPGKE